MKRMNVIVDEKLLEEVRQSTGERTYSATINKALEELSRRKQIEEALDAIHGLGDNVYSPEYLEAIGYKQPPLRRARISADERRVPRKLKPVRRDSR